MKNAKVELSRDEDEFYIVGWIRYCTLPATVYPSDSCIKNQIRLDHNEVA
jgi:hypothetical protein